jgi:hypothetical protein
MTAEYPQIFVSWSSPDKAVVEPFIKRLYSFGLNVKEYGEAMQGGEPIPAAVMQWIKQSKIAVIFYSDETATREWITTEVAWCVSALEDRSIKKIIGVHIGPQSENSEMPMLLRAESLNVRQLTEDVAHHPFLGGESEAFKLARSIAEYSGIEKVQVLPAAVFAMRRAQAEEVLVNAERTLEGMSFKDYWRNLCGALGMGNPPELLERLKKRYGDTAEDLRPYENGETIIELVNGSLRALNERHKDDTKRRWPPLFVRWVHDDLLSSDSAVSDDADSLWRQGPSLLVIDSLSTWAPEIRTAISARVSEWGRSSLLWIPPYTQQIGAMDQAVDDALKIVFRVRSAFRAAEKDLSRTVTADAMNGWAMRRWLDRVLHTLTDRQLPSDIAVDAMQQAVDETRIGPNDMWRL